MFMLLTSVDGSFRVPDVHDESSRVPDVHGESSITNDVPAGMALVDTDIIWT